MALGCTSLDKHYAVTDGYSATSQQDMRKLRRTGKHSSPTSLLTTAILSQLRLASATLLLHQEGFTTYRLSQSHQ
jgi:hypothetical protein